MSDCESPEKTSERLSRQSVEAAELSSEAFSVGDTVGAVASLRLAAQLVVLAYLHQRIESLTHG